MYFRSGGQVNRGFEGGQSNLAKRFPKRGFRQNKFNIKKPLEQLNLGTLAYFIQKGKIDATKPITMKHLLETGCVTKIQYGVKLLSKGGEKLKALGVPINIEVSDSSASAIQIIKANGGSVQMKYRTPLIMRYFLKPHKFGDHKTLKTPMPSPKIIAKLEKIKEKGIDVEYPRAPWYTDNKEAILAEAAETERRIANAQFANLLPKLPADRSPGNSKDIPRIEKSEIPRVIKYTGQ